ncbi:uncharacterized protein N7459_004180 [Penicillium hispanicum]|uniref:uncharacterized protein n=1 Tax=Penicillium hispanicum TaxID=1080232 RepID=UPI00253FDF53|nr:uncharacterized protein N7459_004180 [Penicillium hispanicum]KAJ5584380.1 hypothetical protein N7459_004180 [Penicillium hispanicum]
MARDRSINQTLHQKSSRSRQGCWTCREKKVKCDEERPQCRRCKRLDRECDYAPRRRKPYPKRNRSAKSHLQSQANDAGSSIPTPAVSRESREIPLLDHSPTSPVTSPISPSSLTRYNLSVTGGFQPSLADQEAIGCFRTVVSASVDTKDPAYSVPAIIASLGESNSMVMHMVCALGFQELSNQQAWDPSPAMEHYSSSMLLLAQAVQRPSSENATDLDSILATLWLMILYEQRYGDGIGQGLVAHLRGAAMVLKHRLGNLRRLLECNFSEPDEQWRISPFAGRMIVWIAFLDASAESLHLGGDFNRVLGDAMSGLAENEIFSRLRGFTAIHRYSASLHTSVWESNYPQSQLLDDLESRELFYLYGECGQIRHILAQLTKMYSTNEQEIDPLPVARALHDIGQRYSEILSVAPRLDLTSAGDRRCFVTNVRFVVPIYHAAILSYFRITAFSKPFKFSEKQRHGLQEIFTLAYQAYQDEGESAMARIAWPLFMAALETDDLAHQDWVSLRFARLRYRGENYRRAEQALLLLLADQRTRKERVNLLDYFQSDRLERFII